jgi:hypothetical protein
LILGPVVVLGKGGVVRHYWLGLLNTGTVL